MTSNSEFSGELVLLMGDLHIPHRTEDIPPPFKKLLGQRVSQLLCTGNLCQRSAEDLVRSFAINSHFVKGDQDTAVDFPEHRIVRIGDWSIGLVHGHQIVPWGEVGSLSNFARGLGADVLVYGHSHRMEVRSSEDATTVNNAAAAQPSSPTSPSAASPTASTTPASPILLLNPGSITGAYSPFTSQVTPSFILLSVQSSLLTIWQYELQPSGEVNVTKSEWRKPQKS